MARIKNTLTVILVMVFTFSSCNKNEGSCTEYIWYEDSDSDGFGNAHEYESLCGQPKGYVLNAGDIDDTNANINPNTVWQGDNITFTKPANADWKLEKNQDRITDNVWITRQNRKLIYNYKWWQDTFSEDPSEDGIDADFWNDSETPSVLKRTGGTKRVRWALLDDTGSSSDWTGYNFGTLGDPTNFYSFNNIIQMIEILEDTTGDFSTIDVTDDFTILFDGNIFNKPNIGDFIVGKKFGVWLVEDNVYLTLTFISWSSGNNGGGGGFSYTRSTMN